MQAEDHAYQVVEIRPPYIKLEQFLKWAGACQTGGEAKMLIAEGLVTVNRQVCTLRGKKLSGGERVDIRRQEGRAESGQEDRAEDKQESWAVKRFLVAVSGAPNSDMPV
jgi:ribosome-associated protein